MSKKKRQPPEMVKGAACSTCGGEVWHEYSDMFTYKVCKAGHYEWVDFRAVEAINRCN